MDSIHSRPTMILKLMTVLAVLLNAAERASGEAQVTQDEGLISLALLSTFPRSGTSWVRELIACASGLDTRITQTQLYPSHAKVLKRVFKLKEDCAIGGPCSHTSIFPWFVNRSILQPSVDLTKLRAKMTEDRKLNVLRGIKAAATMEYDPVCDEVAAARPKQMVQARQRWMEELSADGALPPPLIKTHYPVVFMEDGIPLTNEIAFGQRKTNKWNRLQNGTRRAFARYVQQDIERYTNYHTYWLNKSMSEEDGAEVFYIRYESFCQNSATVLPKLLEFLGYPRDEKAMTCALSLYPCSFSDKTSNLPEHVHMYSEDELQMIQRGTAGIMRAFGYSFDVATKKLSLAEPSVTMHNS